MIVNASVLISCFNKEEFLDEAITSVLRQTKEPKEIILVHDKCDEPKAHALADTIILRDHVGVAKVRDTAFKASTGSLVLFLDGDDVLSPDYLEKMILVLAEGADIVYPDVFFWRETGSNLYIAPEQVDAKFVNTHAKPAVCVTSLMKREVYENLKGFRELPVFEDMDFFLRALCNGYTLKKAQTLLWYRQNPQTRNTSVDERIKSQIKKEILDQFIINEKEVTYAKDLR